MIEKHSFLSQDFQQMGPKELAILSIISQSLYQPFSPEDNLLIILTALTCRSGVGFNRAMLFLVEGDNLKGKIWLGPRSPEEAKYIWEILSTPNIGYIEIVEYNRSLICQNADALSNRIKGLSYSLSQENLLLPGLAARDQNIFLVHDAWNEPMVDPKFLEILNVENFLCIPLISWGETLGEIVLDNAITRVPISRQDIELAGICGRIAGNYIYTASLHKKMLEMEKLAALGEMVMFIAHQLRNPLVTIGGFTDQLFDPQINEEKRTRNLRIIKNEVERLEKILFKLSQFIRIEKKEPIPVEIRSILNAVLNLLQTKIKSQRVNLSVELEENLPRIKCDPTYVGEALRNVLENALEAIAEGGDIFIRSYPENKEWVVLSIRDTGKGIPKANLDKLFVPFFSTKRGGMGLGLSYVKRVMEAYDGHIKVESEEGKGTTFKLFFRTEERGENHEKDPRRRR